MWSKVRHQCELSLTGLGRKTWHQFLNSLWKCRILYSETNISLPCYTSVFFLIRSSLEKTDLKTKWPFQSPEGHTDFAENCVWWSFFLQDMTRTRVSHKKRGLVFITCHRDLCCFNCCEVWLGTGTQGIKLDYKVQYMVTSSYTISIKCQKIGNQVPVKLLFLSDQQSKIKEASKSSNERIWKCLAVLLDKQLKWLKMIDTFFVDQLMDSLTNCSFTSNITHW